MVYTVLLCVLTALLAGGLGYLLARVMHPTAAVDPASAARIRELELEAARQQQAVATLTADLAHARAQADSLGAELRDTAQKRAAEVTELHTKLQVSEKNIIEQRQLLTNAEGQLREAFTALSAETLSKASEQFLTLAETRFAKLSTQATGTLDERKAQIDTSLAPIKQLLDTYQVRLAEIELARTTGYTELQKQLSTLAETQRTLSGQTDALVSALRKPQGRGRWGEITLRRLVELAGLQDRCDFSEQTTTATGHEDGGKIRPDMIIQLPAGRQIVVDAKAPIDSFLSAVSAKSEEERARYLEGHAAQVRSRGKELAGKAYWGQFAQSPEFVVMFLPGEAFFSAAVETDPNLYESMLNDRVVVATPTTLLALLRSVEFGWRQDHMTKNAEEIRKLGGELFERLRGVAEKAAAVGDQLGKTVAKYNDFVGSFESRALVSARKMGELGIKSPAPIKELEAVDLQPRLLKAD
jgi:DNA recombination protein RmuC